MTNTAMVALPQTSDPNQWSPEEKALVEAAGLVHTDGQGNREAAPRPVVAAFLQHCKRTGLDPFARQIYCIARKNRGGLQWSTQVSIDGARLVAERTGTYEGQTTPEFTADGVTWTQVWLADEPPKAARVGVFRRGFREPLYAIALWEAYAVYQDVWSNGHKVEGERKLSAMWAKMGPLMLAKCAEMLALRKAFPQDLSGLYSTEEMDQAGAPREVVREAERPAAGNAPTSEAIASAPAQRQPSRDWAAEAEQVTDLKTLTQLANKAQQAGELGLRIGLTGDNDDGSAHTVMDVLKARKAELERPAHVPMVDVPAQAPRRRQWVREARAMRTRDDVRALFIEAKAAGAPEGVLDELGAIEGSLPEEEQSAPVREWAIAEPGASEWVEGPDGEFIERALDAADADLEGQNS